MENQIAYEVIMCGGEIKEAFETKRRIEGLPPSELVALLNYFSVLNERTMVWATEKDYERSKKTRVEIYGKINKIKEELLRYD
jgi:hypothetical protein